MEFGMMEFSVLIATTVSYLAVIMVMFSAGCAGLLFIWKMFETYRGSSASPRAEAG